MKTKTPIFILLASALLAGCAATPVAPIATAPTTQPIAATPVVVSVQPTPAQVVSGATNAVVTYAPLAQSIVSLVPGGLPYAALIGVVWILASYLQSNPNALKTPVGLAGLAQAIEAEITPLMPKGTTAAQIATIVSAATQVAQAQAAQAPKA